MDILQKAQEFEEHLSHNRRVTFDSLKGYRSTVYRFTAWAKHNRRTLNTKSVSEFLRQYGNASSANTNLRRLSAFATFCGIDLAGSVSAKEDVREIHALDSRQLARLTAATSHYDEHLASVVIFLAETGLRLHEFCALQPDVIRYTSSERPYIQVFGKGRKTRDVPLSRAAIAAFHKLNFNFNAYFIKKLYRNLPRAGKKADLRVHVHPHLLRATFISIQLNEKRTDSAIVAKIAGHSSVDTMLKHYLKVSTDRLYEAVA